MKNDWKSRFRSPVFVTTLFTAVISFLYTVLGLFGVVPPVSRDNAMNVMVAAIQLLSSIGILNNSPGPKNSDLPPIKKAKRKRKVRRRY